MFEELRIGDGEATVFNEGFSNRAIVWLDHVYQVLNEKFLADNAASKKEIRPHQDQLIETFKKLVVVGLEPSIRRKLSAVVVKFHSIAETYTVYWGAGGEFGPKMD